MTRHDSRLTPVVALGVCLVTYSFLVALWLNQQGSTPAPLLTVREWINVPLGIGEDFGVLGIGLLLVPGGYLLAEHWSRGAPARLTVSLALRATLPLVLLGAAAIAITQSGGRVLTEAGTGRESPLGLAFIALSGEESTLGLGWVPVAAGVFFVLFVVTSPLFRWSPVAAACLQLGLVALLVLTGADAAGWYHDLGALASFVTLPLSGFLVWAVRFGRMPNWAGGAIGIGCYAVLVVAERGYDELLGWWYPLTWVYAVVAVLVASTRTLPNPAPLRWLAGRAYSLLLAAGVAGYAAVDSLDARLPAVAAMAIALVAAGLAAEVTYRLGELLPMRLLRGRTGAGEAGPDRDEDTEPLPHAKVPR